MAESKHTPTPWHVGYSDGSGADEHGYCITHDEKSVVFSGDSFGAHYGIREKADAEFIVRAVNAHDELVAAVRAVVDAATHQINNELDARVSDRLSAAIRAADAALAKAEA